MATPWDQQPSGWLQLLALGVLAWQLNHGVRPAQAAWLSWVFASAWLTGTFWWLFVALHTYGGLPAWMAALAVVALAGVLSLYYAIAGAAFVALAPAGRLRSGLLFAALWLLAEMARGIWFTGFGWGAAGYAHIDLLARAAPYVGAYGVAALAAFVACLLAASLRQPAAPGRWRVLGGALLTLAATYLLPGGFTTDAGTPLRVALLQGNIAQDEKFQPGTGIVDSLRWYGEQLSVATAALVVAPETAIPLLPTQLPDGYWTGLEQRFRTGDQAALIGIPLGSDSTGYTNSVVGFQPDTAAGAAARPYRYDKHHLVPFGEFIPPFFRWFTEMMSIPLGDFGRGGVGQASFNWKGQRLAPNVCYEDLFGEELGARFLVPAQAPTIFVNLSNIGWFGNTVAIDQHLSISRMRALEFERPFIRATNTGATAVIDHAGRVTHELQRHTRGVLQAEVQGRDGTTPYAWWVARFGLWPLWILAGGVVLLARLARRRRVLP